MSTRLLVSTRCPTCDAPIDFSEGTNSIQCQFCRSNLLVTGRKQTLSYFIPPKLNLHRAIAKVNLAHKRNGNPCRVIQPHLYFIPYYRLTGHDLRWEEVMNLRERKLFQRKQHPLMASLGANPYENRGSHLFSAFQLAGNIFSQKATKSPTTHFKTPLSSPHEYGLNHPRKTKTCFSDKRVNAKFHDRYVEKNFIACNLNGVGLYSLGVRPSVLRLELFHKETVQALGKIAGIDLSPQEAFYRGMRTFNVQNLLYRQVLGQVLSIIYFPYWIVEIIKNSKPSLSFVDAVSEKVVEMETPVEMLKTLDLKPHLTAQTIGFRPLNCPNCGWDLPLRPDDAIFFCSSCSKPWQIFGTQLYEIQYTIAKIPNTNGSSRYLPFWVIQTQIKEEHSERLFLPAFRFTRLKAIKNLARVLTSKQPVYEELKGKIPELHGCFYDQEDALKFAQLTHVEMSLNYQEAVQAIEENRYKVSDIKLTWFPFTARGLSLLDPFTGFPILRNLLR